MAATANNESFMDQAGTTLKRSNMIKQGGSLRHMKKEANSSVVKEAITGRSCHRGTCLYPRAIDRAHATMTSMEEQRLAGNNHNNNRARSPAKYYSNQAQPKSMDAGNRGGGSWQEAYLDIKRRSPYRYQYCAKVFEFFSNDSNPLKNGFTLELCIKVLA